MFVFYATLLGAFEEKNFERGDAHFFDEMSSVGDAPFSTKSRQLGTLLFKKSYL